MAKIYVLDTNVLLSDPLAILKFNEHTIHIPFIVLDELDNHKKGYTDLARQAREATRQLEQVMENEVSFNQYGINSHGGILTFTTHELKSSIPSNPSNDNIIIEETLALSRLYSDREVILVSRDINMRVKAKSLLIPTEDYRADTASLTDEMIIGRGVRYSSELCLSDSTIDRLVQVYHSNSSDVIKIQAESSLRDNMIFAIDNTDVAYSVLDCYDDYCEVQPFRNYFNGKDNVWGIRAKNVEQNIALNVLTDPNKQLVAISGAAGCGKTLVAVAGALECVFTEKHYDSIMFVKEVGAAAGSEEVGFLPGTKIEKIEGYMGPLFDNLKTLTKENGAREKGTKPSPIPEQILERIEIETPAFLRGRSIKNTYIIIDETQNLTNTQMKLILTRAGEGTKIVMLGNVSQIDSAFLSASSNGFTHSINAFIDWPKFSYVDLKETVRSELANEAVIRLGG
jgi:PhoH-like ATPase